jgi:N-methylhydantoinase B/oxoprolinase/acetone carboxylase alpha subunit
MNATFERLKIQANIRRLIDEYGLDTALELYRTAIEKEMRYVDYQISIDHKHTNT